MAKQNSTRSDNGIVRVIGGAWRGRKLSFPAVDGLRPTSDRIRETLFNWLREEVGGARCLDVFSGSGALGFEAASRGAAWVTLIERHAQAAAQLKSNKTLLSAENCEVLARAADAVLSASPSLPYQVVFLDPPFAADLWAETAALLTDNGWLATGAKIYVECPRKQDLPAFPDSWTLTREKTAGAVKYCLFEYQQGAEA